jgi:hypothetical protein
MRYLSSSKLAKYREENLPMDCPIMQNGCCRPCVDHNHSTGLVRGVVSMEGNTLLGRIENSFRRFGTSTELPLSGVLRNIADYLDAGDKDILHPVGVNQLSRRFSRQALADQSLTLKKMGVKKSEINSCNNSKQRTDLYRNKLKATKA